MSYSISAEGKMKLKNLGKNQAFQIAKQLYPRCSSVRVHSLRNNVQFQVVEKNGRLIVVMEETATLEASGRVSGK